jgi:hypothetical protein
LNGGLIIMLRGFYIIQIRDIDILII